MITLRMMEWRLASLKRVRDNPYWGPEHRVDIHGSISRLEAAIARRKRAEKAGKQLPDPLTWP